MIIIRLRSGLGNQMFQYAFFLQLRKWYGEENVKLDVDSYHWKDHNGRELDKVFNLDLAKDAAPLNIISQMADVKWCIKNRILWKLRGRKHVCYVSERQLTYENYKSLPENIYLEGYWQEEHYFYEVSDLVRTAFTFSKPGDMANKAMLEKITNSESVAIHVRHGDYIKSPNTFPMCSVDYYLKAKKIIYEKINNPIFYIFSDDINWCKKNVNGGGKTIFVCINSGKESYKDMMLMLNCKHQIIANSTFSWWSAWLNPYPQKLVIYPVSVYKTMASMPFSWIMLQV
jgi:hypothetical protein